MGRMQRTKGANGERELARLLRDELGTEITRNWQAQAAVGGADLVGLPGWSVEVKRSAKVTDGLLREWWSQTERQADAALARPVLIYRADRRSWQCAVRLWDLLQLGPAPGFEHDGVRPVIPYSAPPADLRPDPGGGEGRWPGWTWTATLSVPGFACLVRELATGPSTPPRPATFRAPVER